MFLFHQKRKIRSACAVIVLIFLVPVITFAAGIVNDKQWYLPSDETFDDNLFVSGEEIVIDGNVKGDVIAAGGSVEVRGNVEGDIIAAAGEISVSGHVGGNVRVAGGDVRLFGDVEKNVNVFSGQFDMNDESHIGGTMTFFGGAGNIAGSIGRDLYVGAGQLALKSMVERNATIWSDSEGVSLHPKTRIGGDFTYTGSNELLLGDDMVAGKVHFQRLAAAPKKDILGFMKTFAAGFSGFWLGMKVMSMLGMFLVGLVMIFLKKKKVFALVKVASQSFPRILGYGFLMFIIIPICAVIAAFTVVGLPLAATLVALYLVMLYLSKVVMGIALGHFLLTSSGNTGKKGFKEANLFASMFLGIFALSVMSTLPLIGWLISLIAIVWGFGVFFVFERQMLEKIKD
ncbi:MAG: polymer-forming cytoskeletal protein [Parcubacteria group bacterium]|nr:polymer-forming cytoskeletal protein [Parcubacteria group bacterium]